MKINDDSKEKQLEDSVSKSVRSMYNNIEIPDGEEAWIKMKKKLDKRHRRYRFTKTVKLATAIACFSLVLGLFLGTTNDALAFKNIFSMAKNVQQGIIHIIFGESDQEDTSGAKTSPPPDNISDTGSPTTDIGSNVTKNPEEVTLDKAQEMLDFSIRTLSYIPKDYEEKRVTIFPDSDGKYRTLRIEFQRNAEEMFFVNEKQLIEGSSGWRTSINESSGKIVDVNINDVNGVLVVYTNGGTRLEWLSNDVVIEIYGELIQEEILEVARGMIIKRE